MRPVCAAATVLDAKDWRAIYRSIGAGVGGVVVGMVTGVAVV